MVGIPRDAEHAMVAAAHGKNDMPAVSLSTSPPGGTAKAATGINKKSERLLADNPNLRWHLHFLGSVNLMPTARAQKFVAIRLSI